MRRRFNLKGLLAQMLALSLLLALGWLAVAGPYGLLAWGETISVLETHRARIAVLEDRRDEYGNLVELLDPQHVDSDLATELARRNLNVAHPDEYIIEIEPD